MFCDLNYLNTYDWLLLIFMEISIDQLRGPDHHSPHFTSTQPQILIISVPWLLILKKKKLREIFGIFFILSQQLVRSMTWIK